MDLTAQRADDVSLSTVHNTSAMQWMHERVQPLLWPTAQLMSVLLYQSWLSLDVHTLQFSLWWCGSLHWT